MALISWLDNKILTQDELEIRYKRLLYSTAGSYHNVDYVPVFGITPGSPSASTFTFRERQIVGFYYNGSSGSSSYKFTAIIYNQTGTSVLTAGTQISLPTSISSSYSYNEYYYILSPTSGVYVFAGLRTNTSQQFLSLFTETQIS